MSEPLTPADCDLRDFQFMPLDVRRLRDSDLAALETPEACWAAVQLWGAAWHQVPAGSLPNDDRVLAQLAGYGRVVREWLRVKEGALRGFIVCSDGRLYHPVVAEKAVEAWRGKLEQRWRTECARIKKHNQRTGEGVVAPSLEEFLQGRGARVTGDSPDVSAGTGEPVPRDIVGVSPERPPGNAIQGKGRGTGNLSVPDGTADEPPSVGPDQLAELRELPVAKGCWRLAILVLTDRGGMAEPQARSYVGRLKAMGLNDEDLWSIAEAAWNNGTQDPRPYLAKAAEQAVARRAGGPIDAPPERQQRAWMDDWAEKGAGGWKVHERGPRPGEAGCRVSTEILAEYGIERAAA